MIFTHDNIITRTQTTLSTNLHIQTQNHPSLIQTSSNTPTYPLTKSRAHDPSEPNKTVDDKWTTHKI